jgi:hypothetical protein
LVTFSPLAMRWTEAPLYPRWLIVSVAMRRNSPRGLRIPPAASAMAHHRRRAFGPPCRPARHDAVRQNRQQPLLEPRKSCSE